MTRATLMLLLALMALLLIPAPLLPPMGLADSVQSALGIGYKAAYLACAIALQITLYGCLGLAVAFSIGPGSMSRSRLARLLAVPVALALLALAIRSVKLGHVPMLANALIPMAACVAGAAAGLAFRQHGWRPVAVSLVVLSGGLLWSFFPGVPSGLRDATQVRLQRMIEAGPGLPAGGDPASGDERFGALLRTALSSTDAAGGAGGQVERHRAALVALGVALGHERLARLAGLDENGPLIAQAAALRAGTTVRGREDWARHYTLSAALAVVQSPFASDAGGLIKEELDALTRGTGFSFGDLAADRAGVRFARAATASEESARALSDRLAAGFVLDDYFPQVEGLSENLTPEQFRRDFGGVGSPRYREALADIEARLDRCPGLTARR